VNLPPLPQRYARGLVAALFAEAAPIDLRIVGRTLLHAALVGAAAGAVGAGFFAALGFAEHFLLHDLCGYLQLRAAGESIAPTQGPAVFRPWLLVLMPAAGALLAGLLIHRAAPEAGGGGGDATIEAFHQHGGRVRRRVIWVKPLASILTLGSGGAGGREGPTMHIGAAIGAIVARTLKVGARERRILLVAGVAAGIAAVFRTPLGAALLATELLYRDDFESDALIPALLASVVSYSVFISLFGESTLFAHAARYPFVPAHLPLYALSTLFVSMWAIAFLKTLRAVQAFTMRLRVPAWLKPAIGGLALGALVTPIVMWFGVRLGSPGQGFGFLGGGYGAAQLAITGASWLPPGWTGVQFLLLLAAVKLVAASLTVGSGGSAGDFAPCLALGGLAGGAFGRAVQVLLDDPRLDPGAFALVGMGTFYGGLAHAPLSALVLVCELTGSYDLLVPLMLAGGIAFVALRKHSLYPAQVATRRDSPAHALPALDVMSTTRVAEVMISGRPTITFEPGTPVVEILQRAGESQWQDTYPVLDATGKMVGMITPEALRILAGDRELEGLTVAADAMVPPLAVRPDDDLRTASGAMLEHHLREVPVVDGEGHIIGLLDEADVGKAFLEATRPAPPRSSITPTPTGGSRPPPG
jgi:CIC family chloride channel protein